MWGKKKGKPTLREQRHNVRAAIMRAMTAKDFGKVENLEGLLYDLDRKIKKEK